MKKSKHRFTRSDQPPQQSELSDEVIMEIMRDARPDVRALCEVALDPLCPNASRTCRSILLRIRNARDAT